MIDFLVIGGGIAGISAAARLSHLGTVTVLEAEVGLGYHASGRSAAMFEETYGSPSTVALNRGSREYLSHTNGGVLSPRGLMLVGSEDTRSAFAQDMDAMSMQPMSVDMAITKVPILNPDTVTEIGYHSDGWDIDTDLLIQNFAREVRKFGGRVLTGHQVTEIHRDTHGWTTICKAGEFSAKILVNAAGAWVDQVAEMAGIAPLGFKPLRRSVALVPAPEGLDMSNWPMLFGPGEAWYAKPDAGKLLISPAEEDPATPHDAWPEDLTLAQGIARFEAVVTSTITRLDSSWAGLRTFSPDRSLVIGADVAEPAFFWAAGQGGYGFQTCAAASQLLADLVSGQRGSLEPETIAALSPARFS